MIKNRSFARKERIVRYIENRLFCGDCKRNSRIWSQLLIKAFKSAYGGI